MKAKIGLTITRYQGVQIAQLLDLARYSGIEFIEISKDIFDELDQVIPKIRSFETSFHLPLIPDNGWDFSCLDFPDEINELIEKLNTYQDVLRIRQYVAHPPEPTVTRNPLRTSYDFLLHNLARLQQPIFLENVYGMSHPDYLQLSAQAQDFLGDKFGGLCFDGPHYFLNGYDPAKMLLELNSRVRYVHLSDCSPDCDLHEPFSPSGAFPIDEVLQVLKEFKYDGWINLEIQPKSIQNIASLMHSYLKVLRQFRPGKYFVAKMLLQILLWIAKNRIKNYAHQSD